MVGKNGTKPSTLLLLLCAFFSIYIYGFDITLFIFAFYHFAIYDPKGISRNVLEKNNKKRICYQYVQSTFLFFYSYYNSIFVKMGL
jgi:hypothetical protein